MRSFFPTGRLLVSLGVAITLAPAVQAAPVLDRDTTTNGPTWLDYFGEQPGWYGATNQSVFTTVVAGASGLLSELDIRLAKVSGTGHLELLVYAGGRQNGVAAGDYTGAVYTQIFEVNDLPASASEATKFDLSSADFNISAGETFSFQLRAVGDGLPSAYALGAYGQTFSYAASYVAGNIGIGYDDYRGTSTVQFRDYHSARIGSWQRSDRSGARAGDLGDDAGRLRSDRWRAA